MIATENMFINLVDLLLIVNAFINLIQTEINLHKILIAKSNLFIHLPVKLILVLSLKIK